METNATLKGLNVRIVVIPSKGVLAEKGPYHWVDYLYENGKGGMTVLANIVFD